KHRLARRFTVLTLTKEFEQVAFDSKAKTGHKIVGKVIERAILKMNHTATIFADKMMMMPTEHHGITSVWPTLKHRANEAKPCEKVEGAIDTHATNAGI